MISLRLWLLSLLFVLPFYTYSLNQRPNQQAEDVFEKRDFEELKAEFQKRQDIFTDTDFLASLSSAIDSVSDVLRSITENTDFFPTESIFNTGFDASLSSLVNSLSSDIFAVTTTSVNAATTSDYTTAPQNPPPNPETTSPPAATPSVLAGTPGQVITDGTRTGTVGDDGTTRFCSASSFLCPASVSYGCCKDDWTCGLTACTPPGGGGGGGASSIPTANIATFVGSTPTSDATFSFTKGGSSEETSGAPVPSGGSKGLSGGAIGGIVGGVIGGIAIIAAGIVWFCLSKRKKTTTAAPPPEGPKGTEQYTGGPIPPQPQMAQYNNDPRYQSPPPPSATPGGYYQPYPNQPGPTGYSQYGQNVQELGGAALPYQKTDGGPATAGGAGAPQPPPQGISEAPANPVTSPQSPPPPQETQAAYGGYKGPSGPVYELS
ncbi:hypothetical protein TWF696_004426 [Orbilia brochopaga]|uniref:Mid2 domain-containing protein n=1 Tax=Orbilia brochopaga TaxID=3140254 RepID=A0AAV9V626_9PEZI